MSESLILSMFFQLENKIQVLFLSSDDILTIYAYMGLYMPIWACFMYF